MSIVTTATPPCNYNATIFGLEASVFTVRQWEETSEMNDCLGFNINDGV